MLWQSSNLQCSCSPRSIKLSVLSSRGGQLGEASLSITFPDGWFLDENGNAVRQAQIAPTDIAAAAAGLSIATLQLLHPHWSLNNLLACLIATDILQVCFQHPLLCF